MKGNKDSSLYWWKACYMQFSPEKERKNIKVHKRSRSHWDKINSGLSITATKFFSQWQTSNSWSYSKLSEGVWSWQNLLIKKCIWNFDGVGVGRINSELTKPKASENACVNFSRKLPQWKFLWNKLQKSVLLLKGSLGPTKQKFNVEQQ